jgi:formamidopyrimidine-DNA glycosylase
VPELPETETIARDLDREVSGARIGSVNVFRPDVLRGVGAAELQARLAGTTIVRCWRRAKLVVIDLSTGDRVVVQPRFTGALLIDAGALPERERRYVTLELRLRDGRAVVYRDIRRLGTVALMSAARFEAYTATLGIEPLDPAFTAAHLSALVRVARRTVKQVLMDQRVIAGVGNIYANEALWRAGVDPSRQGAAVTADESAALRDGIVSVLTESIAQRGTSFRDYRDARGERGGFVDHLAVYGRGGEPCLRCGHRLVETHAIDGRTTVLCANCQK